MGRGPVCNRAYEFWLCSEACTHTSLPPADTGHKALMPGVSRSRPPRLVIRNGVKMMSIKNYEHRHTGAKIVLAPNPLTTIM
eukprot:COSAG02_NODE_57_length_43668_cov_118.217196_28_plen_82_part_00